MQMRFLDINGKEPVSRTHCGDKYIFNTFQEELARQAARKKAMALFLLKKKKIGSKVVILKKHLSSRSNRNYSDISP